MKNRSIIFVGMILVAFGAMACGEEEPNVADPSAESQGYIDDTSDYTSWSIFGEDDTPKESATHGGAFVVTYGNSSAHEAIEAEDYPFPEGTLIVKEQYPSADAGSPNTLSIMAKRSDDENDWYWLQTDTSGSVRIMGGNPVEGDVSMCSDCHGAATTKDMVYVDTYPWAE